MTDRRRNGAGLLKIVYSSFIHSLPSFGKKALSIAVSEKIPLGVDNSFVAGICSTVVTDEITIFIF
jgi:hypothetical protein